MEKEIKHRPPHPPKIAAWILSKLIDSSVRDQAMGDFEQQFNKILENKGLISAYIWYWFQILAAGPAFLKNIIYWGIASLKNNLKVTFRLMRRQKLYSLINIFGLSIGIACCILIYLFVQNELSYDKYHENRKNIYRVILDRMDEDAVRHLAYVYAPLGPALMTDYPDISSAVRFFQQSVSVEYNKEKKFQENRFFFTDSTIFNVFSFKLTRGSPNSALQRPGSILITKNMAKKYFGNADPIGKVLKVESRLNLTVTGVLENVPENSHFKFDFLTLFKNLEYKATWHWPPVYTYLLIKDERTKSLIETQFENFTEKHIGSWAKSKWKFKLQPLEDIFLFSQRESEIEPTGNIKYIYIYSVIAVFILLIACINFMNLSTARYEKRAKEVGIRKVVGADRITLIKQFSIESVSYTIISLILALALINFTIPVLNNIFGKNLNFNVFGDFGLLIKLITFSVFIGLTAGSYPAFFLSRFQPAQIIQSKYITEYNFKSPLKLRYILVTFQFTISIILIIGTITIYNQLDFLKNTDLGYDRKHLIVIPIRDQIIQKNFRSIKNEILSNPDVVGLSACSSIPWSGTEKDYNFPITIDGSNNRFSRNVLTIIVEHDFINTMGMKITEG
ncbi:ABC transporter permease, partial [candidate division KSB1 bacterium]